jgi:hypothetical protein
MKRIIITTVFLLNMISWSHAENKQKMYVWVDNVNVRSLPDFSRKAEYMLREGEEVILTGEKSKLQEKAVLRGIEFEDFFYKIIYRKGEKGWVFGGVLTPYKLVDLQFKLKWEYEVGLTTFRSSIKYFKKSIYIGSNGNKRDSLKDSKDGVYIIDSASGRLKSKIPGNFRQTMMLTVWGFQVIKFISEMIIRIFSVLMWKEQNRSGNIGRMATLKAVLF